MCTLDWPGSIASICHRGVWRVQSFGINSRWGPITVRYSGFWPGQHKVMSACWYTTMIISLLLILARNDSNVLFLRSVIDTVLRSGDLPAMSYVSHYCPTCSSTGLHTRASIPIHWLSSGWNVESDTESIATLLTAISCRKCSSPRLLEMSANYNRDTK